MQESLMEMFLFSCKVREWRVLALAERKRYATPGLQQSNDRYNVNR